MQRFGKDDDFVTAENALRPQGTHEWHTISNQVCTRILVDGLLTLHTLSRQLHKVTFMVRIASTFVLPQMRKCHPCQMIPFGPCLTAIEAK